MQYVTNDKFAILLIPECKQYSIREMGKTNGFQTRYEYDPSLQYIVPYRESYGRIIRAIAADLHEVMLDAGFVNLNKVTWASVREQCMEYIIDWVDTKGHLPIVKNFCHTGYLTAYVPKELANYKLIDVEQFDLLPNYIKSTYGVDIGTIPELPEFFYDYTVPYWEIDSLYNSHKKMRTLIDEWCARDLEESTIVVVDNLFINP